MEQAVRITKAETYAIAVMQKIPVLSHYATARGWSFLISWGHRLAGLTLIAYMFAHLYTLSLLFHPATFDADMRFLNNFVFAFLEWCVALPVIFHSLNGGRLVLYEIFRMRADELAIRSMVALGFIYIAIVGYFFIEEGRQISATLFWSVTIAISIVALLVVLFKVWLTRNSLLWKLQRVTGAFMFPMLIGHMLFMHMNYLTGHDSKTILLRLESPFIRGMDFVFVIFLLFHAGYGLFSIIADYIKPGPLLKAITLLVIIVMVISAFYAIRLIVAL
jgi:succinate dehydrogenase hydrophobic membrane anchor protein